MRRIPVVDDDRRTRFAIGAWLGQCGFRGALTNGDSDLVPLSDGTFDPMIVDVFMADMRGFDSIRVFHGDAPSVPLLAIPGYTFSGPEQGGPCCFWMVRGLGSTRWLRRPARPARRLGPIDERMSRAEQRRKHTSALTAVASAPPNTLQENEYGSIRQIGTMPRPLRAPAMAAIADASRSYRRIRQPEIMATAARLD